MTSPCGDSVAAFCHRHGEPVQRTLISVLGVKISVESGCSVCDREDAEQKHTSEQRRLSAAQRDAGIPPLYQAATLSPFPMEAPRQKEVLLHLETFTEHNGKGSTGLILLGGNGTGKTHVACAVLNTFLQQGLSGRYCASVQDILRPIKETWKHKTDTTEHQALRKVCAPYLLIVDEVGVHPLDDRDCALLTEIINDRYSRQRPTILITNLQMPAFADLVGERVVDRFREGGKALVFKWPSMRQHIQRPASHT